MSVAADIYPTPETSGTAFFTDGLAWSINNGLHDRETYEPVVKKAWLSLLEQPPVRHGPTKPRSTALEPSFSRAQKFTSYLKSE